MNYGFSVVLSVICQPCYSLCIATLAIYAFTSLYNHDVRNGRCTQIATHKMFIKVALGLFLQFY